MNEHVNLPPEKEGFVRVYVRAHKQGSIWRKPFWRYQKIQKGVAERAVVVNALTGFENSTVTIEATRASRRKKEKSVVNAVVNSNAAEIWVPVYRSNGDETVTGWYNIRAGRYIDQADLPPEGLGGTVMRSIRIIGNVAPLMGKLMSLLKKSEEGGHAPRKKYSKRKRTHPVQNPGRKNGGLIKAIVEVGPNAPAEGWSMQEFKEAVMGTGYRYHGKDFDNVVRVALASNVGRYGIHRVAKGRYRVV